MKSTDSAKASEEPRTDVTACGARIQVKPKSPSIHYQCEILYLCGEDCQQIITEDPLNSCLASRLLSGR